MYDPRSTPTGPDLVVIPVYNDWASAELLLRRLADVLADAGRTADVLVVDDGSTEPVPAGWPRRVGAGVGEVRVLTLCGNLGHQRALAVGLSYVHANGPVPRVVVMDGDGEDAPADVPRLLDAAAAEGDRKVVFAERTKRSEGVVFRAGYVAFRWAHWLLTGVPVRVGNFSVVPAAALDRLVVASDLWNHFAATVVKARVPFTTVPTRRAARLAGRSRMNLVGLVVHGLSAIAVFGDRVGVRLLFANLALMAVAGCGMTAVLGVHVATDWAVPGWATTTFGLLALALLLGGLTSVVFVLVILAGRGGAAFLPVRDYSYYVGSVQRVSRHAASVARPTPVGQFAAVPG